MFVCLENEDLMVKITSADTEEQIPKDARTQMTLLHDEIERQNSKCQNISLELQELRRRNMALTEDDKLMKGKTTTK